MAAAAAPDPPTPSRREVGWQMFDEVCTYAGLAGMTAFSWGASTGTAASLWESLKIRDGTGPMLRKALTNGGQEGCLAVMRCGKVVVGVCYIAGAVGVARKKDDWVNWACGALATGAMMAPARGVLPRLVTGSAGGAAAGAAYLLANRVNW